MLWFLFAILAAALDATYYALVKKFQKNVDYSVLASGIFLTCSIILFAIACIKGIPDIKPGFYYSVVTTVTLNVLATVLYFRALRYTDLSVAVPLLSLTPVLLIISAFIFLRESPSPQGIMGIVLVVAGLYYLNSTNNKIAVGATNKGLLQNKGVLYMVAVAVIFSISVSFDKLVVLRSDPIFGTAVVELLLGTIFVGISISHRKKGILNAYSKNMPHFLLIGLVSAFGSVFINIAFLLKYAAYVIAIKRVSILFTMLYAKLFFKEKFLVKKTIGALAAVVGMGIILFS